MKRNTSNWSNFGMLLRRAGLTASAGLSCLSFSPVVLNYVCRLWLLCMQIVGHVICPYRIILYLIFNAEFCLAIMRWLMSWLYMRIFTLSFGLDELIMYADYSTCLQVWARVLWRRSGCLKVRRSLSSASSKTLIQIPENRCLPASCCHNSLTPTLQVSHQLCRCYFQKLIFFAECFSLALKHALRQTRHWSIAWPMTLRWMSSHVSIRCRFRSDKLVLGYQFYKEYQTGSWWDIFVGIFMLEIIIVLHSFCKVTVAIRCVQFFMPHSVCLCVCVCRRPVKRQLCSNEWRW